MTPVCPFRRSRRSTVWTENQQRLLRLPIPPLCPADQGSHMLLNRAEFRALACDIFVLLKALLIGKLAFPNHVRMIRVAAGAGTLKVTENAAANGAQPLQNLTGV